MDLLILSSGLADKSWQGLAESCPLRSKGKRQAQKVGAWMGRHQLRPDLVLTTGERRARVSAEKALKAGGWSVGNLRYSEALSAGEMPDFPDTDRVMLAGNRKTLSPLFEALGVDAPETAGELARFQFNDGKAELVTRVAPQDLEDLFPFPSPDGPEQRERPAYYYNQSAVIPFRRCAGEMQIMIVGSSSGRHWVVPKGIVEPGLSPSESAEIEAREEAGVLGRVTETPVGSYVYRKWGSECHVEVFLMEVRAVIPDEEWEESTRHRQWVSATDAARLLKQEAFRHLVLDI